jgi:hypothetical protein
MAVSKVDAANQIENKLPQANIANNVNFRNFIINGDMSINQRGQQTGLATGYTECDRFAVYDAGTDAQFTTDQDTSVPSGQNFSSSLKLTLTTADSSITGNNEVQLYQNIEAQNLQSLGFGTSSAKSLVLSFWVKSSVVGDYILWVYKPDTTSRHIAKLYNIATADTWQKVTFEIPGDTDSGATIANDNGNGLSIVWQLAAGPDWTSGTLPTAWEDLNNANRYVGQNNTFIGTTNATFFLTGVQLEAGTTASDFEFLPHDVNLKRCLRYFEILIDGDGGINESQLIGSSYNSTRFFTKIFMKEYKRADATISSSNVGGTVYQDGGGHTVTALANTYTDTSAIGLDFTATTTSGDAGHLDTSSNTLVTADAEL